jgi:hypothetical protein
MTLSSTRAKVLGQLRGGPAIGRSPAHERQRRRKAAQGERRVALPRSELLGGGSVGGDEPEVGVAQLASDGTGDGMDGRRGRLLGPDRLAQRILGQDGGAAAAEGFGAGSVPMGVRPPPDDTPKERRRFAGTNLVREVSYMHEDEAQALDLQAKKERTSKSEIIRRAVRHIWGLRIDPAAYCHIPVDLIAKIS